MSSPSLRDENWADAVAFLKLNLREGEHLIAPLKLRKEFKQVHAYQATFTKQASQFHWLLVHKGRVGEIDYSFLKHVIQSWAPVFANQVFVVFSSRSDLPPESFDSPHLISLIQQLKLQDRFSHRLQKKIQSWQGRINQQPAVKTEVASLKEGMQRQFYALSHQLSALEQTAASLQQTLESVQQDLVLARSQTAVPQLPTESGKLRHKSLQSLSRQELEETCRAACQTSYLGNQTLLCRVLGRYLLYGEAQDLGIVPHLSMNGFWEPWITLAFARALKPGWRCLDVGANHGYYSLLMSEIVGASGRVLALEPNPKLAKLVEQTLEINGFRDRAAVIQKAVSDQSSGKINLVIPRARGMNATVCRPASEDDEVIEVETVTLNQLTQDWETIDFIKVDAEGAEELIWQGMLETIRKHPSVILILEFNAARCIAPQAFLESILAEGFVLQHIDFDAEIKPLTMEQCMTERPGEDWMLFLQRDRHS